MRGHAWRWLAVGALLLAGAGCSSPGQQAAPPATVSSTSATLSSEMTVEQFAQLIARPGVVVLDVRTPAEFSTGHVQGAINIDVQAPDFASRVGQLDRNITYALYCRTGRRSEQALQVMRQLGFSQATHLPGGITAWIAAGQPTV
jgi:phage shock protein E